MLTGDRIVGLLWMAMAMVFVGSSLMARRLSAGRTMVLALAWVGIFTLAFGVARLFR